MKIIIFSFILCLISCYNLHNDIQQYANNKEIFTQKNELFLSVKNGKNKFYINEKIEFELLMQKEMSIKNLKNILFIGSNKSPDLEYDFTVKKIAKSNTIKIKIKKLLPGLYDFYYLNNNKKEILLSFKVMHNQPKLISQNFLVEEEKNGANIKQNIFMFEFDKPIKINNNTKIIIHINNKKVLIKPEKIFIKDNLLTVFSRDILSNKYVNVGDDFIFEIDNLVTIDDEIVNFEKIPVKLIEPQANLLSYSNLLTKVSHNSVRFYLQLNNLINMQVCIFQENENECLGEVIFSQCRYDIMAFCEMHVTHLEENSFYKFKLDITDYQSKKKKYSGSFNTTSPSILLKEVMIHPDMNDNKKQNQGEFIKITSIKEDIFISDLLINVVNKNNLTKSKDFIVPINKIIKKGEDLFIGGKNFDPSLYKINNFVSTDKVSLGMSDKEEKIITIFKNNHEYFDEYHGFLWSSAKGHSIVRKNLSGIDEEENYSYLAY